MAKRKCKPSVQEGKRQAVFFDLDGTLLRHQSTERWIRVAAEEGFVEPSVFEELLIRIDAYKQRRIDYTELQRAMVDIAFDPERMDGASEDMIRRISEGAMSEYGGYVHSFTTRLARAARDCGALSVMVTGALHDFAVLFGEAHGIHEIYATRFAERNDRKVGYGPTEWFGRKGEAVDDAAERYGIDLSRSVAVGDTESDAPMLAKVGYPICFCPTVELESLARANQWPMVIEFRGRCLIFRTYGNDHSTLMELMEESVSTIFPANILNRYPFSTSEDA